MELFVIQCTTCRARLKVHDPAVVGQIIECPKCRSFVAVTPPPNWQAPADSQSAPSPPMATGSPAAASGSSGVAPEKPATAGFKATSSGAPVSNAPGARNSTPPPLPKKTGSSMAGLSSVIIQPLQGRGAPSAGRTAAAGAWAPPADRAPAVATTASLDSERPAEVARSDRRAASVVLALIGRYRWWIVSSAVGVLAVASVAWVFARSHDIAPPAGQIPSADGVVEAMPGDKSENDPATPDPPAVAPAKESLAAESSGSDQRGDEEDPAAAETEPAPSSSPASTAEGDRLVAKAIASAVDPLGPVPNGSANADSPAASTESAGSSPEPNGAPAAAMEDESGEAVPFDPVKQARLMTHLQDKLPALEFTGVPLGQFVAFLSEFSTVPMVIDTQSLVEAGKSAKSRVSVKLDDATVEEALKAALDKPGLAFHVEPGRLVITPRSASSR